MNKYKNKSSKEILKDCKLTDDQLSLISITSTRVVLEKLISWFKFALDDWVVMYIETNESSFRNLQRSLSRCTNGALKGKLNTAVKLKQGDKTYLYIFVKDEQVSFIIA